MTSSLKSVRSKMIDTSKKISREQNGVATFFDNLILQEGDRALKTNKISAELRRAINTYEFNRKERFTPLLNRISEHQHSDIEGYTLVCSQGTKNVMTWLNEPLFKSVFDLSIYQMLITEISPKTIIEIGASKASLTWLKQMTELNNQKIRIIGIDSNNIIGLPVEIDFINEDILNIKSILNKDKIKNLARPILIIEDAHAHLEVVYDYVFSILEHDDYFIIEDSITKQKIIKEVTNDIDHSKLFVDTKYTDYFGINSTTAVNSIITKRTVI